MKTSLKPQDYHEYFWKKGEWLAAVALSAAVTGFLAFFFYRSMWALVPLSPLGLFCFRRLRYKKLGKAREELTMQFRECILAAATSLQAGYAAENAFLGCAEDMKLMYGENAYICKELALIRRGLAINISLEELLLDLARRSGSEEISQFAVIFSLAKRNGGNMAEIIKNSAALIGKQIEKRQEIQALLAGRKMELNIMKVMPFGILCYINIGNPGYFDMLYHNLTGVAIMTGCLLAYLAAFQLGEVVMRRLEAENES